MGVKGLFLYLARFCISVVVLVGKGVKGWKYLGRDGFKESTVIMGYGWVLRRHWRLSYTGRQNGLREVDCSPRQKPIQ